MLQSYQYHVHTLAAGADVALDSAADILFFQPGVPVSIIAWGYSVSVLVDMTQAPIVKLDIINSDGTRGDGDGGTITGVDGATNLAIGKVHFTKNVSPLVTAHPTEPMRLRAGEQAVMQITTAATAGDGTPFILYSVDAFVGASGFGALGALTDSSRLDQATEFTA